MTATKRHFVNVGERQVHLRRAGSGPAVVLLHATPRSSESLLWLVELLATQCTAIALDIPGYGLSEPLSDPQPTIEAYAAAVAAAIAELGVTRYCAYGEGSGACIALELALASERCCAIVARNPRVFAPEITDEELERHAPPLSPAMDGSHLIRQWGAIRDEFVFAPWWDRRSERRLHVDMPSAQERHAMLLERLRAGMNYAAGHWAAARYAPEHALERLGSRAEDAGAMSAPEVAARLVELAGDGPEPPPTGRPAARPGRQSKMYVDTPYGQTLVRFREEGAGRPVVLMHASPVSGFTLEGLVAGFAPHRPVYALDTIANGESDKPDVTLHPQFEAPSLAEFAPWLLAVLDGLGFDQVDLYGSHTGAMIALEAAIQDPSRFASLVLDGVTMHDEEESAEIFSGYFADIRPKEYGAHLLTAWSQMQDVTLWHPWFVRDAGHISEFPIISARQVHEHTVEMLKRGEWHERCYRPVYEYPTAERLPLLTPRTLIATPPDDYLERFSVLAASLAPNAQTGTAPRSVTYTELYYAPFVPDSGVAEYYLRFFEEAPAADSDTRDG